MLRRRTHRLLRMSALNWNAQPFYTMATEGTLSSRGLGVAIQDGSSLSSPAASTTPTVLSSGNVRRLQLSPQSINQSVTENNAFLFAQNLLHAFKDLDQLRMEQELGNVDDLKSMVAMALQRHPDPPTFVANALITVGTVSGFKELNKDLELEVSKILVDILCAYIDWRRQQDNQSHETGKPQDENAVVAKAVSLTDVSLDSSRSLNNGYYSDASFSLKSTLGSGDLMDMHGEIATAIMSPVHPRIAGQPHDDLMDSYSGAESLLDLKPLKPAFGTLIDLSEQNHIMLTPVKSSVAKDSFASNTSSTISLIDLDEMNDFLSRVERRQIRQETRTTELLEIFGEYNSTAVTPNTLAMHQQPTAAVDSGISTNGDPPIAQSDSDVEGQQAPECHIIKRHHQDKLLAEIRVCKNALPVFAALDVYELQSTLKWKVPESVGSLTYGKSLARQLYDMGRYRECAVVISRYLGHACHLRGELIPRLLERNDDDNSDTILDYVGGNLELCRTVLWHINHQLTFQFYYWGLITSEISKSDRTPFLEIPPIHGVGKSRIQTQLVETAIALILQFDLEEEQESFVALHLFVQFCTIVSLLEQSAVLPITRGAAASSLSSVPSSVEHQRYKQHEYSLKSPTRFCPIVLGLVKESVTLQQMTIQYCIAKRDHQTADYFTRRLGLEDSTKQTSPDREANLTLTSGPVTEPSPELEEKVSGLILIDTLVPAQPQTTAEKIFQLAAGTKILMVDSAEGLKYMSRVLQRAQVLAMDTEWLPNLAQFRKPTQSHPDLRTSIVQITSDVENTVFLMDAIALLRHDDRGQIFVGTLGHLLSNKNVLKLAYDWVGDQDLLETTFPALREPRYQPVNLLDLKHVWLANLESSSVDKIASAVPTKWTTALTAEVMDCWSTTPSLKGMAFVHGGLSRLLTRLCGVKLDKTQQCSHWEQRPLTEAQKQYAASDAQCLLRIYAVLQTMRRI